MTIGIDYGVMSRKIEEQLNWQGFSLYHNAEKYEKVRIAINMCMFHCATQREVENMRKRLHKKNNSWYFRN